MAACSTCGGRGKSSRQCSTCRGGGQVLDTTGAWYKCNHCGGSGLIEERCARCMGTGIEPGRS